MAESKELKKYEGELKASKEDEKFEKVFKERLTITTLMIY